MIRGATAVAAGGEKGDADIFLAVRVLVQVVPHSVVATVGMSAWADSPMSASKGFRHRTRARTLY